MTADSFSASVLGHSGLGPHWDLHTACLLRMVEALSTKVIENGRPCAVHTARLLCDDEGHDAGEGQC